MGNYEWVEHISVNKLSNTALLRVSRFARILKQQHDRVLVLRDPELAKNMVDEVLITNNRELEEILDSLLEEFHTISENDRASSKASKSESFEVRVGR